MATFDQVSVVMAQLGERLQCQAIAEFEKNQAWIVMVDDATSFELVLDDSLGLLQLVSEVATLPEPTSVQFLELILQYNDQWRATGGLRLGLSTERQVTLIATLPALNLDAVALAQRLVRLTEMVNAWRELIAASPAEAGSKTGNSGPPLDLDRMIRL
jgi:hypothetical protein